MFCTNGKIGIDWKWKSYQTCAVLSIQAISNWALARVRTIIVYARGIHRTIVWEVFAFIEICSTKEIHLKGGTNNLGQDSAALFL